MAGDLVDFNPVSRITVGTVGPPGQRVFLLQASQGVSSITVKVEKEQVRVLSSSILELLDELDEKYPRTYSKVDEPLSSDLMLQEPFEPAFVAGQIGLGYDKEQDLVVLVIQEIQLQETDQPSVARFWVKRPQMKILGEHAAEVVTQGRPICPLCDAPIDPDGHFCPKSNGHEQAQWL